MGLAHASFSVNEQRGIAMNLRFEEEKKHEQRMQFLKGAIRFLIMVAAVVFLAWLIITFALKKVSVIGSSMETTLYNGEDVIVNKTSYVLFPPKRNQIIAFYPEVQDEEETINSDSMIHIRRVAGLPGEKVQIKNGKLYINGEEQKEKYDFEEEDFMSAEIEIVPAGKARDLGLDRSMVAGYGHDDRICAYTSLLALLETESTKKTSVVLLVDKEEVGSIGATGMQSRFFENAVAELMDRVGEYSELKLRRALANSKMLSSDVTAAFDPNYAGAYEKKNSAFFGKGLAFAKYTGARGKSGCNDANAEFVAWLRNVMDENDVAYQMAELGKVDQGGGGTIAYILAEYGMEVIDCGVALQNMHAPWEVASKVDIFETMRGYKAFLMAE